MALDWYLTFDISRPKRHKIFSGSSLFSLLFYGFLVAVGVFVAGTYIGSIKSSPAGLAVRPDTVRLTVHDALNYPIQSDTLTFGAAQSAASSLFWGSWSAADGKLSLSFNGLNAMTQRASLEVWFSAQANSSTIAMSWSERVQVALNPFSTIVATDTVCWGHKIQTQIIESANAYSDLRLPSSLIASGIDYQAWLAYKGHLPLALQFDCQQFRRAVPANSEQLVSLAIHIPPKIETL